MAKVGKSLFRNSGQPGDFELCRQRSTASLTSRHPPLDDFLRPELLATRQELARHGLEPQPKNNSVVSEV